MFQALKSVVWVNLLMFGQANLGLMTVRKCITISKKDTFSFFASFFRRILGLKGDFFHSGWWFSTNQWFKNQNYISGFSRTRTTFLYSLLLLIVLADFGFTFLMYEILLFSGSRKKEKISKVIIRKLPIRRKWHSETKNIESIFASF